MNEQFQKKNVLNNNLDVRTESINIDDESINQDKSDIEMHKVDERMSLNQPLLQNQKKNRIQFSWRRYWKILKEYFGVYEISQVKRKVMLDGMVTPPTFFKNLVKNQKYSIITFVPQVLFEQFKYFFNLFFLAIAITQFFDILRVGYLFTNVAPLALVLTLTMCKEAYDDYKRFKRDKEANLTIYRVLGQNGFIDVHSSDLKVGMIVEVNSNMRIPADMILLYTNDPNGSVFVRTDQLDGETDWKLRSSIKLIQDQVKTEQDKLNLIKLQAYIKASEPIENIYDFTGVYIQLDKENLQKSESQIKIKESLKLQNTLWANMVLASGKILGIVIYVGKETRMAMNSRSPRTKMGRIDNEINFLTKLLFLFMVILSAVIILVSGYCSPPSWNILVQFNRYIILLSSIIPISMRVNLDFAKLIYSYRINVDDEIKGTIARNSAIPEELGRIQYLLTDKTGTLTQNDMIFKRISLEHANYTNEDTEDIQKRIIQKCQQANGPMADIQLQQSQIEDKKITGSSDNIFQSSNIDQQQPNSFQPVQQINQQNNQDMEQQILNNINQNIEVNPTFNSQPNKQLKKISIRSKKNQQKKRDQDQVLRDLITALAVCHNVTPIITDQGDKEYQASSPDEVALVKMADSFGLNLIFRDQFGMQIKNAIGQKENYQILNIFPFSSETKRMGIVIKHVESGNLIFYLKGADTIIKQFLPEHQRGFVDEECDNLARQGLRTLVITQKHITQDFYNKWSAKYKAADELMEGRIEAVNTVISQLEKDMDFLGITGVEDKLQNNLCETLENLRNAGIKVWMLTGDKLETAICIAISSGLKAAQQNMYIIKEQEDDNELKAKLNHFNTMTSNSVLVIDGNSLKCALANCERLFFDIATQAPAVVCCRCSPTQKAIVVECIKKYTHQIAAAIGDGGNDVGMIQSADVGIGIVGKEGLQAALAADFSILQFSILQKLLLWHGRLSYKRSALLGQFVIHRGLLISLIQTIFTCVFYFVSISIYNGALLLGYATIFTMFPVFSLIFDEDVNIQTALKFPQLYKNLQKARELNTKTFICWIWKATYQSGIIMILSLLLFNTFFIQIETITFTVLIFTEYLLTLSELNRMHILTIITNVASLILYLCILLFMNTLLQLANIMEWDFIWKILVLVSLSWFPLWIFKILKKKLDPTDYEKIMQKVTQKFINTQLKQ